MLGQVREGAMVTNRECSVPHERSCQISQVLRGPCSFQSMTIQTVLISWISCKIVVWMTMSTRVCHKNCLFSENFLRSVIHSINHVLFPGIKVERGTAWKQGDQCTLNMWNLEEWYFPLGKKVMPRLPVQNWHFDMAVIIAKTSMWG